MNQQKIYGTTWDHEIYGSVKTLFLLSVKLRMESYLKLGANFKDAIFT